MASAPRVLRRAPVDIVVVDDDLDVPALLTAVQQPGGPAVLVIVITVVVTEAEIVHGKQAGAFACVPKPFDLRAYRRAVEWAAAAVRARGTADTSGVMIDRIGPFSPRFSPDGWPMTVW